MFPTEMPQRGVQVALKPVFQGGRITGEVALAAYEILGYALYQLYGNVNYPELEEGDPQTANMMAQAPPEVHKFMEYAENNRSSADTPPWLLPFMSQLVQWGLERLCTQLGETNNPTLFGIRLRNDTKPEGGGIFPERKKGRTPIFTKTSIEDRERALEEREKALEKRERENRTSQSTKSPAIHSISPGQEPAHSPTPRPEHRPEHMPAPRPESTAEAAATRSESEEAATKPRPDPKPEPPKPTPKPEPRPEPKPPVTNPPKVS